MGIPLRKLQRSTSSSEFLEWQLVLEDEIHTKEKQDFYLAQIACEIRRSYAKRRVTTEQFLMSFVKKKGHKIARPPVTKEEKDKHIATSKAAWIAHMPNLKVRKRK